MASSQLSSDNGMNALEPKTPTPNPTTIAHRARNAEHQNPSLLETPKNISPRKSTRSGRKVKQANYDMKHHPMDTVVKPRTAAKRAAARDYSFGLEKASKVESSRAEYESLQGSPATSVRRSKKRQHSPESTNQSLSHDTDTLEDHQTDLSVSPPPLKDDLGNSTTLEKSKGLT